MPSNNIGVIMDKITGRTKTKRRENSGWKLRKFGTTLNYKYVAVEVRVIMTGRLDYWKRRKKDDGRHGGSCASFLQQRFTKRWQGI